MSPPAAAIDLGDAELRDVTRFPAHRAHAARALELATGDDRTVGDREVDRAGREASAGVHAVLNRLPPAPPGGGRAGELMRRLDLVLRS